MDRLKRNDNNVYVYFVKLSLLALSAGMLMGIIGGLEYLFTEHFTNTYFNFTKIRPLHVTLVLSWIILAAIGCIYYFLSEMDMTNKKENTFPFLHFSIFLIVGIAILISYLTGNLNGREYFEYPSYLVIPIILGWILFFIYFLQKQYKNIFTGPIYILMWFTGLFFMILTLTESSLYQLDFFGKNLIKDLTVQWKSNGALVGCWNMLVYGSAAYVMQKLSDDENKVCNKLTFWLFFLGFSNLLFNWGHHIFIVPTSGWIKIISYAISMTELILLARIIYLWNEKFKLKNSTNFKLTHWFLLTSEYWIFINLSLAILMSVPALNLYTHGTYVTVAHSMGTTIGINSTILLACIFYILEKRNSSYNYKNSAKLLIYFFNIALLLFWVSLIIAGITKGYYINHSNLEFQQIIQKLVPFFISFFIAGTLLFIVITRFVIIIFKEFSLKNK